MKIVATVLFVLFHFTVIGATYYVDNVSGDDTNAGTSTNAPFKHCPGDTEATGNANLTLSAGDSVIFRGAVTYTIGSNATINATSSGSVGSVITYLSGHLTSPSWGVSPAMIDCSGANTNVTGVMIWTSKSNLVANGLVFFGGGKPEGDDDWGAITVTGDKCNNILIQNCTISNNNASGVYVSGAWETAEPSNIVVSNCVMHDLASHGVFFRYGMTDCSVLNSTIYDVGAVIGGDPVAVFNYAGGGGTNTGTKILGNTLGNAIVKSPIILSGVIVDCLIESNTISGSFGYSGLDFTTSLGGGMTNITIRNNTWDVTFLNFQGAIALSGTTNSIMDGIGIYNNTFRCVTTPANAAVIGLLGSVGTTPYYRNIYITNNIFIQTSTNHNLMLVDDIESGDPTVEAATFKCDFNVYNWTNTTKPFVWCGTNNTFAQWQVATGQDVNSKTNTPTFTSSTDFHLASSDTVARGNGANLSLLFTTDKDGNTRPAVGAWDIGAYQYVSPPFIENLYVGNLIIGTP